MSRSVPWRNKPTNLITQMLPVASEYKLYLVHETGPTSFVFKDDNDNKFKVRIVDIKVSIGSIITCSCGIVQNDHCIHTLYVLLKKFKVPATNPIIWQGSRESMQLPIWTRNWKAWCSWNSLRGRRRSARSINTRRKTWMLIKTIWIPMSSLCCRKMRCVLFAMRIWMDSVTQLAKPVRKVYIRSALRFGQGISKIQMLLLLVRCVDRSSWILWWWFIKISRDGRLDFRHIKGRCVEAVGWKI